MKLRPNLDHVQSARQIDFSLDVENDHAAGRTVTSRTTPRLVSRTASRTAAADPVAILTSNLIEGVPRRQQLQRVRDQDASPTEDQAAAAHASVGCEVLADF
jgi:hypothetical protein